MSVNVSDQMQFWLAILSLELVLYNYAVLYLILQAYNKQPLVISVV